MKPDDLLAKDEIREVLTRLARGTDRRDAALIRSVALRSATPRCARRRSKSHHPGLRRRLRRPARLRRATRCALELSARLRATNAMPGQLA